MKPQWLPRYPITPYLPQASAGAVAGDVLASINTLERLVPARATFEEKLDGANVRVQWNDGEPVVGNRDHVLKKGYVKKETPSKLQFRPLWTWIHDNRKCFERLERAMGDVVVFGEWLHAQHTCFYDALPSPFVAIDLWSEGAFVDPFVTRETLFQAGFMLPPLLPSPADEKQLLVLANRKSTWSSELAEGVYVKVGDGVIMTERFKLVRTGFVPRADFNDVAMRLNVVKKES